MLARCIRLDLDCTDLCDATGKIPSRQAASDPAMLRAARPACKLCGDKCSQHGQHGRQHCAACAEACRRCEQACNALLQSLAA